MSAFCAICIAMIEGEPKREPLGRNDAMVNVCDDCSSEIEPKENLSAQDFRESEGTERSQRIKANRDKLVAAGICQNGRNHGPRTHGRLCTKCWLRWGCSPKKRKAA